MRVDDVKLTVEELEDLIAGATLRKRTEQSAPLWFYAPGSTDAQPEATWAIPVGEFMQGELRDGGKSGYAGNGYPFVLDIRLVR